MRRCLHSSNGESRTFGHLTGYPRVLICRLYALGKSDKRRTKYGGRERSRKGKQPGTRFIPEDAERQDILLCRNIKCRSTVVILSQIPVARLPFYTFRRACQAQGQGWALPSSSRCWMTKKLCWRPNLACFRFYFSPAQGHRQTTGATYRSAWIDLVCPAILSLTFKV